MDAVPYRPIDCNFYDVLEAKATLREEIRLAYITPEGPEKVIHTRIKDLYSRNKEEFMLTREGEEIRLDYILQINDLPAPQAPAC